MTRKLAWSNTGSIARIKDAGHKISFHILLTDLKSGLRKLSKESSHPILAPEGKRFVHVQFSNLGHDLVVLDDVGLAHFFTCSTGLGRMSASPTEFGQDRASRNDLDAVIGLQWLMQWPVEFRVHISFFFLILYWAPANPSRYHTSAQQAKLTAHGTRSKATETQMRQNCPIQARANRRFCM